MSHGLWFDDAHGTSWFLPWHREYLYRVEKLLIDKWLEIRGNPSILKSLGWPAKDNGVIYSNEWYNDGLISYIRNPENICLRMPYWHWPKDEGRSPYDDLETGVPMAPFDSNTFGGSGSGNAGGCVEDGFFSNQNSATTKPYVLGDWGSASNPSDMRVNSNNRCLRRGFNLNTNTTFLDATTLQNLINTCSGSTLGGLG